MHCGRTEASKFERKSNDSASAITFIDSDKEVTQTIPQKPSPTLVSNDVIPDLDNRFVIIGDRCPSGYAKIGGWCVERQTAGPDPDYN